MAKKKTTTKSSTTTKSKKTSRKFGMQLSSQQKLILGSLLIILGILMFIAFLSFFFTGKADQSTLSAVNPRSVKVDNWVNIVGAWVSDLFIIRGFGIASFIFTGLLFISGIYVTLNLKKAKLIKHWIWGTLIVIWLSIFFGFFAHTFDALGGTIGFEMNSFFQDYIGVIGTILLLTFALIAYLAVRFKITGQHFVDVFKSAKKDLTDDYQRAKEDSGYAALDNDLTAEAEDIKSAFSLTPTKVEPTIEKHSKPTIPVKPNSMETMVPKEPEMEIEVEQIAEEASETDNLSNKLVADFGQFDPTLELSKYQFPPLDLLKKYDSESITINQEELEENKNKIVETLNNYNIGISNIKATIGPTVTLYEIVPNAGVRISKIKNLEDDIALVTRSFGHSYHRSHSG